MRENSEDTNLKLVSTEIKVESQKRIYSDKVTSPIRKMLLDFNREKVKNKFRMLDLFKD